jgi:hypothetical protein
MAKLLPNSSMSYYEDEAIVLLPEVVIHVRARLQPCRKQAGIKRLWPLREYLINRTALNVTPGVAKAHSCHSERSEVQLSIARFSSDGSQLSMFGSL